jgi:hypothetical protein
MVAGFLPSRSKYDCSTDPDHGIEKALKDSMVLANGPVQIFFGIVVVARSNQCLDSRVVLKLSFQRVQNRQLQLLPRIPRSRRSSVR